jgi:hypothetical protein
MAKAKKQKQVNFMLIPRDEEVLLYDLLDELVGAHHDELAEARIALAWRFGWSADPDGRLVLGQCKKASDLDRLLHDHDLIILLNYEVWHGVDFSEEQKRALLDHELCHGALQLDEEHEPVEDTNGRKCYRLRKHTIEEFHEIVQRHGLWKADIASFAAAAMEAKHLPLFPGEAPAQTDHRRIGERIAEHLTDPAIVESLRPKPGGKVDSISVSTSAGSVTLHADGRTERKRGPRRVEANV